MATYTVIFPIVGTASVSVEADSKEEAIEKAFEGDALNRDCIDEWEALTRGCRGNVCSLPQRGVAVIEES